MKKKQSQSEILYFFFADCNHLGALPLLHRVSVWTTSEDLHLIQSEALLVH